MLIRKRDVRLRERRISPYKYLGVDRAKGGGETEKKAGERPKEKGSRKQGNKKNQRKRQPITKKHKRKGKNNILRKTITFISISANHLRHRQVRPSFSPFVSAFFFITEERKQGEGNLITFALCSARVV
jgi:hypothetical protein